MANFLSHCMKTRKIDESSAFSVHFDEVKYRLHEQGEVANDRWYGDRSGWTNDRKFHDVVCVA